METKARSKEWFWDNLQTINFEIACNKLNWCLEVCGCGSKFPVHTQACVAERFPDTRNSADGPGLFLRRWQLRQLSPRTTVQVSKWKATLHFSVRASKLAFTSVCTWIACYGWWISWKTWKENKAKSFCVKAILQAHSFVNPLFSKLCRALRTHVFS